MYTKFPPFRHVSFAIKAGKATASGTPRVAPLPNISNPERLFENYVKT
jgi:hypothetical protein